MMEHWISEWQAETPLASGGLCLVCRSVLAPGEACHVDAARGWHGDETIRALLDVAKLEAQAPALEPNPSIWAAAGMTIVGGIVTAVAALSTLPELALFSLTVPAAGGLMARDWFRAVSLRRAVAAAPIGLAVDPLAGLPECAALPGRIIAGARRSAAAAEVAWERLIRPVWAPERGLVIARLGLTAGFTITLDDGRIVAAPAGRVRLVDLGGRTQRVAVEVPHPDVLARLDRVAARVGDRIGLQAELVPRTDDAASYRGAPAFTHVCTGATPVLLLGHPE